MLESELKKEIAEKTTEIERIKTEKEEAELKLYSLSQDKYNLGQVNDMLKVFPLLDNEDMLRQGWCFYIGRRGSNANNDTDMYISFMDNMTAVIKYDDEIVQDLKKFLLKHKARLDQLVSDERY